jgi:pyruvate/2-oxoglutarate dehydrogenase complex dihydrolipoamide dehydrogenase (E3) component
MGSGAIGIEFASFYLSMGADVTVVEMMPTIMPVEDPEISALARRNSWKSRGSSFSPRQRFPRSRRRPAP